MRAFALFAASLLASACTGEVGSPGAAGNPGISWRGAWDSSAAYAVSDAVEHGGSAYVAISASTGSAPPSADWQLFAAAGSTGPAGPGGPQGPAASYTSTTSLDIAGDPTPQLRVRPVSSVATAASNPSVIDLWSSFDYCLVDSTPRRAATIKARYQTSNPADPWAGVWGHEVLSFHVGGSDDTFKEPVERMRIETGGIYMAEGASVNVPTSGDVTRGGRSAVVAGQKLELVAGRVMSDICDDCMGVVGSRSPGGSYVLTRTGPGRIIALTVSTIDNVQPWYCDVSVSYPAGDYALVNCFWLTTGSGAKAPFYFTGVVAQ